MLGLDFLHRMGIVHHDLKPHNIFVDKEGHCVIADFGGARFMNEHGQLVQHEGILAVMTLPYAAPEVIKCFCHRTRATYDHTVDYWSLGAVVVALMFGDSAVSGDILSIPPLTRLKLTGSGRTTALVRQMIR